MYIRNRTAFYKRTYDKVGNIFCIKKKSLKSFEIYKQLKMFHDYSFQLFMNPVREKYVICMIECDNIDQCTSCGLKEDNNCGIVTMYI